MIEVEPAMPELFPTMIRHIPTIDSSLIVVRGLLETLRCHIAKTPEDELDGSEIDEATWILQAISQIEHAEMSLQVARQRAEETGFEL